MPTSASPPPAPTMTAPTPSNGAAHGANPFQFGIAPLAAPAVVQPLQTAPPTAPAQPTVLDVPIAAQSALVPTPPPPVESEAEGEGWLTRAVTWVGDNGGKIAAGAGLFVAGAVAGQKRRGRGRKRR